MQTKKHCPIPFPLPLFSPWAGQQLKSLPMGEKRGRGKGMGHCFCCPHTMGSPCGVWERAKNWGAFRHLFVNLISTTVRHPVDYKHTEDWVCGNPKQRVLCTQHMHCPIPIPLPPFFSPWAGQLVSSLPMGEKLGKGEGMGAVLVAGHTQLGSPMSALSGSKYLGILQSSFCFCQPDKHYSQGPR